MLIDSGGNDGDDKESVVGATVVENSDRSHKHHRHCRRCRRCRLRHHNNHHYHEKDSIMG